MLCLLIVSGAVWYPFAGWASRRFSILTAADYALQSWTYHHYINCHTLHGIGLVLAVFLFSHTRNTTYQQLPLMFGWKAAVSRLDTIGFVLFLLISTVTTIGVPVWLDQDVASPVGTTMFPSQKYGADGGSIDYARIWIEGTVVLSIAGITVY